MKQKRSYITHQQTGYQHHFHKQKDCKPVCPIERMPIQEDGPHVEHNKQRSAMVQKMYAKRSTKAARLLKSITLRTVGRGV